MADKTQREVLDEKAAELHAEVAAETTKKGSLRKFLAGLQAILNFLSPDPGVRSGFADALDAVQKDDADLKALHANIEEAPPAE